MAATAIRALRPLAAATGAALFVAVSACTGEEGDATSTESPDTRPAYYTIPTDPCSAFDPDDFEPLLGPVESSGPDYGDESETISVSGDTYCDVRYNDGANETWMYVSIELLQDPTGAAAEQDPDHEFGYWWAYTGDHADGELESVPEPITIPVESTWESSQALHFTGVSDDRLTWDPDGRGLALVGTFTESNVALTVALTREGFERSAAPDPEAHAEAIADVAEQIRPHLGPVP